VQDFLDHVVTSWNAALDAPPMIHAILIEIGVAEKHNNAMHTLRPRIVKINFTFRDIFLKHNAE
jgi:hypothetical protein